ncbi:MAG: hypothetical protein AB1758_25895, partial [Candidatus Eremiobacterota bacterium]
SNPILAIDWDGRVDDQPLPDGAYKLLLTVQACTQEHLAGTEPAPGGVECAQDDERISLVAGIPRLVITDIRGTKVAVGFALEPTEPEDTFDRHELPKKVFQYDRTLVWSLEASNLSFEGTPPEEIEVQLESVVSGVTTGQPGALPNVVLRGSGGSYQGALILGPDPLRNFIKVGGLNTRTTYTLAHARGLDQVQDLQAGKNFEDALVSEQAPETAVYPKPRKKLGALEELAGEAGEEQALATRENMTACGFEPVRVTLSAGVSERNQGLKLPITTVVKVQHPAAVAFYNFHGAHNDGTLYLPDSSKFSPRDQTLKLGPAGAGQVPQLLLYSCSVLDLNDYNNFFALPPTALIPEPIEHGVSDNLSARRPSGDAPGIHWLRSVAPNGPVVLLGFNAPSPAQGSQHCMEAYRQALDQGHPPAVAWVLGNLRTARNPAVTDSKILKQLFLSACAWEWSGPGTGSYYYIPYELPATRMLADPRTAAGVWRVPEANWDTDRNDWTKQVNPKDIAVPVIKIEEVGP